MSKHPRYKIVFMWIDIAILILCYFFALTYCLPSFWAFSDNTLFYYVSHISMCGVVIAIFLVTFRFNNLYRRNIIISRYRQFILLVKSLIIGCLVLAIFMLLVNSDYFLAHGKLQTFNFGLSSLILFTFTRVLLSKRIYRLLVQTKFFRITVLIVGGDETALTAAEGLESDPYADFHIAGFVDDYKDVGVTIYKDFANLGKMEQLAGLVKELQVDEIIIAIDNLPYKRLIEIVETCLATDLLVRIYSNLLEIVSNKLDVEYYSNLPLISLYQKPLEGIDWQDKRIVDICVSGLALVLLFPFFLLVAAGIKLSSKGPVMYKQVRIGRNGQSFDFYKFRSMHINTQSDIHKDYVQNFIKNGCATRTENDIKVFKITDDPRIFPFGNFIRKTSIDEFPQLFNVLKGDMSLVGPRPCLPYEWECYEDWHKYLAGPGPQRGHLQRDGDPGPLLHQQHVIVVGSQNRPGHHPGYLFGERGILD
jgi:exopolysaccharide biosynthesis polyprenyl glycosylphosphotransferase